MCGILALLRITVYPNHAAAVEQFIILSIQCMKNPAFALTTLARQLEASHV